ncbi:MAG TPA: homoserine dehydrogenase [Nitrospiria bacterium]|nr:homoserine dehydrogenase [Nitrospiria bacterium]
MRMRDGIKVGLIGLGTVGTGVAKILLGQGGLLRRRLGVGLKLARIADLDLKRDRGIRLAKGILIRNARQVIEDPQIEIVVELIGGIHPAKELILSAIAKGKHVVTANKALLAAHGEEIFEAVHRYGVDIGFEGSVGGGIPIIRVLREGLSANRIESIYGIINGTSNYILTKMTEEGKEFSEVLAEAKSAGYAEADPTLDVEGIDASHKLAILVTLAFGTPVDFKAIYTEGITQITPLDIEYAREFGYRIKPLAIAKRAGAEIEVRVHPTMIPEDLLIAKVGGVYNGIYLVGDAVGETLFYGKGAGSMPTASAVVGDILDIARNILKGVCGRVPAASYQPSSRQLHRLKPIEEIESLYYLRIMAQDRPGVLSKISGILGKYNISISSVIQKVRKAGRSVPVVMMTHRALERDVRFALGEIDALPLVSGKTVLIRVEDEED